MRIGGLDVVSAASDFADETAFGCEVRGGFVQDTPDDVEPVSPAIEGELGLGAAFRRQRGHAFGVHIGRIGDDEVVALAADRPKQVAAVQRDAISEAMIADVARGDGECILRYVDRVDFGMGKMPRRENGEAARAGAEIEHASDIGGIHQRGAFARFAREMRVQEFADEGARYDHALIDIEGQSPHIDLVDEIGGRFA